MYNKSFTVDKKATVIGGRNIVDEYFGAREDREFSDNDVVTIGPIVGEVSRMIDAYSKHPQALPIPAFIKIPKIRLKTWVSCGKHQQPYTS